MQDERGLYYYPDPSDVRSRVYVRRGEDGVEFRLWHADHAEVWEKHGWVPRSVIERAAALYQAQGKPDPMLLYDPAVAKALIQEEIRKKEAR